MVFRCGQLVAATHKTCVYVPGLSKDNEACRKKWSAIYNDYKEEKTMNMMYGFQRSEKCRSYQLVDEFMFDKANVVSHAHASAMNGYGIKCTTTSDTNTTKQRSRDNTSKSPEPKRMKDMLMDSCIGDIRESSKSLIAKVSLNGILFGCNNQQHIDEVQLSVCVIYRLSPPRMVFDASIQTSVQTSP